MEWYCAVWNSDKVSNVMGAQFLYEQLCQGEDSLVGDIEIIDEFFEDLISKGEKLDINKGKGFIIIGCLLEDAEKIDNLIKGLAKQHGLSYYEPQNMTYIF